MIIVSNTSPIIAFGKLKKLSLWEKIFGQIFIPEFVNQEFTNAKYKNDFILPENLFKIEQVERIETILKKELDRGEAEAITLAINKKANWLIMDERKGRNIVKNVYGLNVIGTSGILLKAKESGIVNEISPIFQELKKINYFIADDIVEYVCKQAGE